jgi:Spy/CpxP family protein refolding chaperone
MAMRWTNATLGGMLCAGLVFGTAWGQSSSGTMGTNASVRNESTMGGQNTNSGVPAGGTKQGTLNQGSMQAGTGPGQSQGQDATKGWRHGGMNPDRQLAHMTKRYNLTADQQNQIKPVLQDLHDQMMKARQDTTQSRADRQTAMESARMNADQKIEQVLNDQQKQKFEADQKRMEKRRQEHMRQQMNNGGTNGSNPGNGAQQPQ